MTAAGNGPEQAGRVRLPADVEAADPILYGLSFRQLAVLAIAAAAGYGVWSLLHTVLPAAVVLALAGVLGVAGAVVALGRRDGLPLDLWLLAALHQQHSPRELSTTDRATALPSWIDEGTRPAPFPAPLRLPAQAVADDGRITLGAATASIVATSTVNLTLRTGDEQAALVEVFGRWLNSLAQPTQIVVSAQPVDLRSAAHSLDAAAHALPHPALRDACADHAAFLDALAERRDPLRRQTLVVTRSGTGEPGGHSARRRAEDAARSLGALGLAAEVLDGTSATAVLAAAADPYRPPRPGGLASPGAVITGPTTAGLTTSGPTRAPNRRQSL